MQGVGHARKHSDKNKHEYKGKDIVGAGEAGSLFWIFHAAAQYKVGQVNENGYRSTVEFWVVSPEGSPGKSSPNHACEKSECGKNKRNFGR